MAAERIQLRELSDRAEVVARAARLLAEGQLVVFPTETVYGLAANAADAAAVDRLYAAKQRPPRKPLTVHLADAAEAGRYIAPPRGRARRLIERGWPGPLTLVFDRLPDAPGEPGAGGQTVGLRLPDHAAAREVIRAAGVPVVASSANLSGNASPTTADEVVHNVGESVALVLDDGPTRFGRESTVVRVQDDHLEVLRPGVVSPRGVAQLAGFRVFFVCAGNTCRSPMAEAIARRLLARRLKVPTAHLLEAGFDVRSMGLGAANGGAASDLAVATMRQLGYDLSAHVTRALTEGDVASADVVFAMTAAQVASVAALWPAARARIEPLDTDGDIEDPAGGAPETFRECADRIERALDRRLDQLLDLARV